jgi:hypothetical protein
MLAILGVQVRESNDDRHKLSGGSVVAAHKAERRKTG